MALGVPVRLRPRIFSTFGTTRMVGRQPQAPAAFIPGEIPGTHFQSLSRPQGTWFCRKGPRKKSQATPPGIDPGTVRLVAQRLNHYATPYILTDIKWPPISTINIRNLRHEYLTAVVTKIHAVCSMTQHHKNIENTDSNTVRNIGNYTPIDKASYPRRRAYSVFTPCQYKQIHDILQHPTWLC